MARPPRSKDDDNPLTAAMNSLKRQRRKEMSTDDKDRVVGKLLERSDPRRATRICAAWCPGCRTRQM
jgi:hypothetical protein